MSLDVNQPYIELKTLDQNNSFVISKAKTFEESLDLAKESIDSGAALKVLNRLRV